MHKSECWQSKSKKKGRRKYPKETIVRVDGLSDVCCLLALCKSRRGCGFLCVSEEQVGCGRPAARTRWCAVGDVVVSSRAGADLGPD